MVLIVTFALGTIGGFIISIVKGDLKRLRLAQAELERAQERADQLEQKLKHSHEEIAGYKKRVTSHFSKTAELFHTLAHDYRALYRHMAEGAQELCDASVVRLGSARNERLLTKNKSQEKASPEKSKENKVTAAPATAGQRPIPSPATTPANAAETNPARIAEAKAAKEKSEAKPAQAAPQTVEQPKPKVKIRAV